MGSEYSIIMNGIRVPLFEVEYEFKNEGPAVIDFRFKMASNRNLAAEDAIRDIYANFRGRHDSISEPAELLGILLAHGAQLHRKSDSGWVDLYKEHFPLSFEARSTTSRIRIGDYFRTSVSSAGEQFVCFGTWQDRLSGFRGMNREMVYHFISTGLSIVAHEPDKETVLVDVDSCGDIVGGDKVVLANLLAGS